MKSLAREEQARLTEACASVGVVALYAHGSQVHGRRNSESDLDFAFLLAHAALAPPAVNRLLPLLAELYESEEFQIDLQDLRGAPPLFRWRVIENGRLLVCLDTNQLARFHAASISEERDREYFLKPIREAMHARIRSGRFAS